MMSAQMSITRNNDNKKCGLFLDEDEWLFIKPITDGCWTYSAILTYLWAN